MTGGRFPPPWTVEVTPNCFIVRDANWQALSYVYYESNPGRRSAAKLLSKDEGAADCGQHREAAPGQPNHPTAADFLSETFGRRKRLQCSCRAISREEKSNVSQNAHHTNGHCGA